MIKIGVQGAGSLKAGELIRILINHPEVDLRILLEPELKGRSVSSIHHGLIGENIVNFSEKPELDKLDFLFLTRQDEIYFQFINDIQNLPELKVADFTVNNEKAFENELYGIGLSEINRKNLVRSVRLSYIPSPEIVPVLIALLPLARYMLLNNNLTITELLPEEIYKESKSSEELTSYIKKALVSAQPSFDSDIELNLNPTNIEQRVIVTKITLNCSLSLDEIEKIYDGIYDDHNFTFITHSPINVKEVEGNQKCVISLNKPSDSLLEITVIVDGRLRGGAGDAVHVMNLLMGLYEKTGLQLKSSAYSSSASSSISSWFA